MLAPRKIFFAAQIQFALIAIFSVALLACNKGEDSPAMTEGSGSNFDNTSYSPKVLLSDATFDEMAEVVSDCHGKSPQLCVEICHRPPGNPDNSSTKLLPLKASMKHLSHGGSHEEGDYLGSCDDSTTGSIDDESDNGDNASADDLGEETPEGNDDETTTTIPEWCKPVFEIDQNCDGYEDDTGIPLF